MGLEKCDVTLKINSLGRCHGLKKGIKVKAHAMQVRDGTPASYRVAVPVNALRAGTIVFGNERKGADAFVWVFADECSVLEGED